jgi:hypothetical protein
MLRELHPDAPTVGGGGGGKRLAERWTFTALPFQPDSD